MRIDELSQKLQNIFTFIQTKLKKGQRASSLIGNQYTGSIFLALMSTLESDLEDNADIEGTYFGLWLWLWSESQGV